MMTWTNGGQFGKAAARSRREFVLLSLFGATACSSPNQHAPEADLCPLEGPCTASTGKVRGPGSEPMQGGEGGAPEKGQLSGRVLEVVTDAFAPGAVHRDPAWIEVLGGNGRVMRAEWNGEDPFQVEGFNRSASTWFSVQPASGNAWMRTLQLVDTETYDSHDLALVSSDVLSTLFSLVAVPVAPSTTAGHALISFYSGGSPKAGVQVTASKAEFVAYATSGTWSVDERRTDSSGAVLLGNVNAASFPGSAIELRLSGTLTGNISLPVARQAMTLVRVQAQ